MNGQDGAQDDCSVVVTGIGPVFLFDDLSVMCTNISLVKRWMKERTKSLIKATYPLVDR